MLNDQTNSKDESTQTEFITDDRVSPAPLHVAYTSRRNIPKKQLHELVGAGYVIQRGRFSAKENKRLLKNWRRISRKYPELDNPFAAVGFAHKPDRSNGHIVDTVNDGKTKRFFKQSKILERLAYKLDDRLLCDIYARAKKLIGGQAFMYKTKADLPDHLVEEAKQMLFNSKEDPRDISRELDINPYVLQNLKTNPPEMPHHDWTDEEDLLLEMSIERQFCNQDPWSIPLRKIDWKDISKEMITCGLPEAHMRPKQLYKRWYLLNGKLATSIKKRQITELDLEEDSN